MADQADMADAPFRSWVEDYHHRARDWVYDPVKVRRAMSMRRTAALVDADGINGKLARNYMERAAEENRRRTDPLEQAKIWLGKHLRVPVYAAKVAGGPENKIVVGGKLHSPQEVIEMARAGAERLREAAVRAALATGQHCPPVPPALAAVSQPDPQPAPAPSQKENIMVSYASGVKPITVPTPADVYLHIQALADQHVIPMGRAALVLIERGIVASVDATGQTTGTKAAPGAADEGEKMDSAEAMPNLPLAEMSLAALLAEIARRVEQADDEALGDAIARAEAAEAKLAQLRAALAA